MQKQIAYKYCIVPECASTTIKNSEKHFISVPKDPKVRKLWTRVMRRENELSANSTIYVCGDHFKLEEDMENYMRFTMLGGNKRLKKGVVPHLFQCQKYRRTGQPSSPRATSMKRARMEAVEEACKEYNEPATMDLDSVPEQDNEPEEPPTRCIGVQTSKSIVRVRHRSYAVQTSCVFKTSSCSPIKIQFHDKGISPRKPSSKSNNSAMVTACEAFESDTEVMDEEVYSADSTNDATDDSECDDSEVNKKCLNELSFQCTIARIEKNPRLYLGLPEDTYFLINILQTFTTFPAKNIFLTLKKIRTNYSFEELADDFGMSQSNASRIFAKVLPFLSGYLKQLIVWPTKKQIKQQLPISFKARFNSVEFILDCFEIEIEKPSNPVHQALTWSEYKKCNTLKYIVCMTPNGIISFVSTGFGGRTSDATIIEYSGFLNVLPNEGCAVMADRGFKHIEQILLKKNCTLIRPPSVSTSQKSSKENCLEGKRIASVRIHVERLIRRIRELKCLKPHACMNNKIIPYADQMVTVAAGIVNMQGVWIQ